MNYKEVLITDFQTIEDVKILREAILNLQLHICVTRKILGEDSLTKEEIEMNLDIENIIERIEQQLKQQ